MVGFLVLNDERTKREKREAWKRQHWMPFCKKCDSPQPGRAKGEPDMGGVLIFFGLCRNGTSGKKETESRHERQALHGKVHDKLSKAKPEGHL